MCTAQAALVPESRIPWGLLLSPRQGPERSGQGKAGFQASDSSFLPAVAPVHCLCSLQFSPSAKVLGTVTAIVLATLTSLLPSADPSLLPGRGAVSSHRCLWGSLSLILCFSPQVILKDLEVLAEIASSPAGQTEDPGPLDGPDLRVSHPELQVPTPGRAGLLTTPSKYSPDAPGLRDPGNTGAQSDPGLGHPRGCPSPALEFCQGVRVSNGHCPGGRWTLPCCHLLAHTPAPVRDAQSLFLTFLHLSSVEPLA